MGGAARAPSSAPGPVKGTVSVHVTWARARRDVRQKVTVPCAKRSCGAAWRLGEREPAPCPGPGGQERLEK